MTKKNFYKEKCIKNAAEEQLLFRGDDDWLYDQLERKVVNEVPTAALNYDSNMLKVIRRDSKYGEKIVQNQLTGEIMYYDDDIKAWRPWQDQDTTNLKLTMTVKYGMVNVRRSDVGILAQKVASDRKYDPLVSYLNSLKWDGKARVDTLLSKCLGAPQTEYTAEVMLKFMLGMIGRAFAPGAKFDTMLALQGVQGAGKTQFAKILATQPELCTTLSTITGKDALQQIRGKWIAILDEIVALKGRVSQEKLKSFISEQNDDYRPPYGHCTIHVPRRVCFIATTNELEFLVDKTGNRRFWIVKCDPEKAIPGFMFSHDLHNIERYMDQCWAEAFEYFKKLNPDYAFAARKARGDVLWRGLVLSSAAEAERQKLAAECKTNSPDEDLIEDFIASAAKGTRVCAKSIWVNVLDRKGSEMHVKDSKELNEFLANSPKMKNLGRQRMGEYGITRAFEVL